MRFSGKKITLSLCLILLMLASKPALSFNFGNSAAFPDHYGDTSNLEPDIYLLIGQSNMAGRGGNHKRGDGKP